MLFKRAAAAMLAFILLGGSIALYLINDERNRRSRHVRALKESEPRLCKRAMTKH